MDDFSATATEELSDAYLDRELHGWFGEPWQSPICYDDDGQLRQGSRIDVPIGQECLGCGEPLAADAQGTAIPVITATGAEVHYEHRECALRAEVGSLAHLEGRCACKGGSAGDEGRSRREEALLVWDWVEAHGRPA